MNIWYQMKARIPILKKNKIVKEEPTIKKITNRRGRIRMTVPKNKSDALKKIKPEDRHVFEILLMHEDYKTVRRGNEFLEKFKEHPSLNMILKLNFNPKIQSILPDGNAPYKPWVDESGPAYPLKNFLPYFQWWVEWPGAYQINQAKRESMFIETLESIPEAEAILLIAAKDKKVSVLYPKMTLDVVKVVFPSVLD